MGLSYYTIKNNIISETSEDIFLSKLKSDKRKQEYINYKKVMSLLENHAQAQDGMELLVDCSGQTVLIGYTIDAKQIDSNGNVEIVIPSFIDRILGFIDRIFYYGPKNKIKTVTVQSAHPVYIEYGSLRDKLCEDDKTYAVNENYLKNTVVDMRQLDIAGYELKDTLDVYSGNREMLVRQGVRTSELRKIIYPYDLKLKDIIDDYGVAEHISSRIMRNAFKICNISGFENGWNEAGIDDITRDSRNCTAYINQNSIDLQKLSNISYMFQNKQIWLDQPGIDDPSGTTLNFDINLFNFRNLDNMKGTFTNLMFQDYSNRHKLYIHWNMAKSIRKDITYINDIFRDLQFKELNITLEVGDMHRIQTVEWFKNQKKLGTVKFIGDSIDILEILKDGEKIKTLDLSEATIVIKEDTLDNIVNMMNPISLINTVILSNEQLNKQGSGEFKILSSLYRMQAAALIKNIKIKDVKTQKE